MNVRRTCRFSSKNSNPSFRFSRACAYIRLARCLSWTPTTGFVRWLNDQTCSRLWSPSANRNRRSSFQSDSGACAATLPDNTVSATRLTHASESVETRLNHYIHQYPWLSIPSGNPVGSLWVWLHRFFLCCWFGNEENFTSSITKHPFL